jgi:hypothetical protein
MTLNFKGCSHDRLVRQTDIRGQIKSGGQITWPQFRLITVRRNESEVEFEGSAASLQNSIFHHRFGLSAR